MKNHQSTQKDLFQRTTGLRFVVTGSRVYGPYTDDSDLDIVMEYLDAENIRSAVGEAGIEIKEGSEINPVYKGFSFELGGIKFQIICANTYGELEAWEYATVRMRKRFPIEDRGIRVETFRKFRNMHMKGET